MRATISVCLSIKYGAALLFCALAFGTVLPPRAEVLFADYMPVTPAQHGVKTFEWTHGRVGQFTSQIVGHRVVDYGDGTSLAAVEIANVGEPQINGLVCNDGSVVKFLGITGYYLSSDRMLTSHPDVWSFGSVIGGMTVDQRPFYVVKDDLSQWSSEDTQMLLFTIQDVRVLEGTYVDAVIVWYLDTKYVFTSLDLAERQGDLGITRPGYQDTRGYAITGFDIFGFNTGLIASADIQAETGKLVEMVELKEVVRDATPPDTGDLAGTWRVHHLNAGDAPAWLGWSHFDLAIDTDGNFSIVPGTYLNSSGDTDAASTGTMSVADDRILSAEFDAASDNRNAHGALSSSEEFAVMTMDDEGGYNLSILQRHSDVDFAPGDVAGTWSVHGLVSGDAPTWTGWYRFEEAIDSNGVIHVIPGSYLDSAGGTDGQVGGTVTLARDGVIRMAETPTYHGVLSSNNALAVGTVGDAEGGHHLTVALRRTGVLFARSDLTGRWHLCGLAVGDNPQWTGWIRGTMDIGADGTFAGATCNSDGQDNDISGSALLTDDGMVQLQDEGLTYARGTMSNTRDVIVLLMTDEPGDKTLLVMTRAEPYVSLADYLPVDSETYGIKAYEWTYGRAGVFTSQVLGSETVRYTDGTSLTGANIMGLGDVTGSGDPLIYNDGSVWKLLGVGDVYLSCDEYLSHPSSMYTFGAVVDGMLIEHEGFWVKKDLSGWSYSDDQVVLCEIQDVTVLEGSYPDAVILWFLDKEDPFLPLQFSGKNVDLGITLPNSPEARPYGVTDFDIYARGKGLIAQGYVSDTGELESLAELKSIEPVSTYTAAGVVYTDPDNPLASGLAGVTVILAGDGRTYETNTVGALGLWQMQAVPAGRYTVTPSKTGYVFEHMVDGLSTGQPSVVIDMNAANETANESIRFLARRARPCPDDDLAQGIYRICNYLPLNPGNQWVYTTGDYVVLNETYLSSYGWSGVRFATSTYALDAFLQNGANGLAALARCDSPDGDLLELDPPLILIPAEMQAGHFFQQEYVWPDGSVTQLTTTLLGTETILVPAGEFTALRVDIAVNDVGQCAYTTRLWFAKNVGMVKIHRVNATPPDCLGCIFVCRPDDDIELMNTPAELVSAIVDGRKY